MGEKETEGNALKLVLSLVLVLGLVFIVSSPALAAGEWSYPASAPAAFITGVDGTTTNAGSASNPYAIASAQELANFAYLVNNGNKYNGSYFKLTADINLNPGYTFEFDQATGLMLVYYNGGTAPAFGLGSGIKGTSYNTSAASLPGTVYAGSITSADVTDGGGLHGQSQRFRQYSNLYD